VEVTVADAGFEEYCATRGRALLRLAYALTGDVRDAEDLVQTALLRCYRRWGRIDEPDAYLRTVMVRTHVGRRRRPEYPTAELPDRAAPPGHDTEARADVMRLLAALGPRQRAIVVLRYMLDLSDAQIAAHLDITESTVRTQAARALAKLRSQHASHAPTPGAPHD
jgi:RNA polymerase sigma-70 factor (sigma-E family)